MFITENDKRALRESGLFDTSWYLHQNPEVNILGMDPLEHYLWLGLRLGRNPGPGFDSQHYLHCYQDVAKKNMNPLLHYLRHGRTEGREPLPLPGKPFSKRQVAQEKAAVTRHPGLQQIRKNRPVVLLCSHVAGDKLFGSERSLLDMLVALKDLDFNVVVTLPGSRNAEYLERLQERSIAVYDFPYGWWREGSVIDETAVACFARIIADENVQVVHSNTIVLREPLVAAQRMGVRRIIHVRELIRQDAALLEMIGESADDIIKQVWDRCDMLIANSQATMSNYATHERESALVYNTVDFETLSELKSPDFQGVLRVGLISSNLPKKGIADLADIARKLAHTNPRLRFCLIGPENEHVAELSRQIDSGELPPSLRILGYRSRPVEAIAEVDIVVSLSHFQESFGRTVLEGMAAGRPVLVYDHGAPPELVEDGKTGVIVPVRDIDAAAAALARLDSDRAALVRMGQAARAVSQARFGREAYLAQMRCAYDGLLEDPASTAPKMTLPARRDMTQTSREHLKIAYFCWHFPVPSETFVLNELRLLRAAGADVRVFCKQSPHADFHPDFDIEWERVRDADHLAERLKQTERNIVHAHFVYPTVTDMVWPACQNAGIPFTCIAHAQDIFRTVNAARNRVDEFSRDPLCRAVFTLSQFHRNYLLDHGVPAEKLIINSNCIDPDLFADGKTIDRPKRRQRRICAVSRFTEKKGLDRLIRSGKLLEEDNITIDIYGYGELEDDYRRIIAENSIHNVNLRGAIKSRDALLEVFRTHDLFACPSVRAKDGDMDGIPTTLMEAMAAGLPVLTTDVAGIPELVTDGLTGLVAEATPQALADAIRDFYAMPESAVESLVLNAEARLRRNHNGPDLVEALLRVWNHETVDLMIVSWNNLPQTSEVIRRLYRNTALPFHLIICDNGSDAPALAHLLQVYADHDNVTLVLNRDNAFVGPGTNICLAHGQSDYAIYVCGKEGMTTQHGWEKLLINYMNAHPDIGLGGTLCYSPSYLTGRDYPSGQKLWENFRNKDFALDNPDRIFSHVQGGFFVLRRRMIEQIGGFSNDVPHGSTDVEFSYYVESTGWKLGEVPGMISLFNKTRPGLIHRIDETMGALHPPMLEDLPMLDAIAAGEVDHCNLCGRSSVSFHEVRHAAICPKCGSDRRSRSIFRSLAESVLLYRRLPALAVGLPVELTDFWMAQFQGRTLAHEEIAIQLRQDGKTDIRDARLDLALLNDDGQGISDALLVEAARVLKPGATLLVAGADAPEAQSARLVMQGFAQPKIRRFASAVSHYDWRAVIEARRAAT